MASLLDMLLTVTDPVNATLLGFIYLRLRALTDRVSRLEDTFIAADELPTSNTPSAPGAD